MPARRSTPDPVKALWLKLPPYVRNRYFLTLVAFTAWMIFADRHDVMTQYKLSATVERLEDELDSFDEKIAAEEAERRRMENNRERFARESYYMQKDDEDVFIIVEKD